MKSSCDLRLAYKNSWYIPVSPVWAKAYSQQLGVMAMLNVIYTAPNHN